MMCVMKMDGAFARRSAHVVIAAVVLIATFAPASTPAQTRNSRRFAREVNAALRNARPALRECIYGSLLGSPRIRVRLQATRSASGETSVTVVDPGRTPPGIVHVALACLSVAATAVPTGPPASATLRVSIRSTPDRRNGARGALCRWGRSRQMSHGSMPRLRSCRDHLVCCPGQRRGASSWCVRGDVCPPLP